MPRRSAVAQLPEDQFAFVIQCILDNKTDRELSAAFYVQFKKKLAKSSIGRWREAAGNELADRYQLARFQAKQLLSDLKEEDADKYQVVIKNIEDRLLTATREVITQDPVQLLKIRQNESKLRLRERALELKEREITFTQEKAEREANIQTDRLKIGADTWQFILLWLSKHNPTAVDLVTKNSEELLSDLETHLQNQAA
ncbi:MAG: hypothetical protein AUG51_17035 [Acidobacteria bacterium 13_1_20CM_3_53_8]|nr:MAG: hypothetical protein AUG51_17035 [Acidobacteria bacterium 13_1_20CM_3_53_8]